MHEDMLCGSALSLTFKGMDQEKMWSKGVLPQNIIGTSLNYSSFDRL